MPKPPVTQPIVTGIVPDPAAPASITRRFRALLEHGARLAPVGRAKDSPEVLLARPYLPRHAIELFGATYFLSDFLFDDALGFFVGYVALTPKPRTLWPRIFYKDSSLTWRVASHFIHDEDEYWIGKGDVTVVPLEEGELVTSVEETANLPFEIQGAFDAVSRRTRRRRAEDAVELVVREAPSGRIEPYADFTKPRRRAAEHARVNGGRRVATFGREGDPSTLRFVRGYQPDFEHGTLEVFQSNSKFFGGELAKYRVLSANRRIQYLVFESPTQVWLNPPQTLSHELSSFGVRVDDVLVHDDLCVPGYEYHEPGHSQIPGGGG
ncbi:MAG: hypothetical protein WD226_02605, partial [Planctomycetota bacterium]